MIYVGKQASSACRECGEDYIPHHKLCHGQSAVQTPCEHAANQKTQPSVSAYVLNTDVYDQFLIKGFGDTQDHMIREMLFMRKALEIIWKIFGAGIRFLYVCVERRVKICNDVWLVQEICSGNIDWDYIKIVKDLNYSAVYRQELLATKENMKVWEFLKVTSPLFCVKMVHLDFFHSRWNNQRIYIYENICFQFSCV